MRDRRRQHRRGVGQFASSHADLIICDIGLPDGSGWDLMENPSATPSAIAVSGWHGHDVNKSASQVHRPSPQIGFALEI